MEKDSAEFNPLRSILDRPQDLTEAERISKGKRDALIKEYNRAVPELRLQIPDFPISPYLSLNLQVCADYYFKCQRARLEEDAGNKVAALLTSFLEQHPLEWSISYWKNDFIAELVLGKLNTSGATKEAGQRWLKRYWRREQRMQREIATYVSPKRVAASEAVWDLELLELIDNDPQFYIRPGFRVFAEFVNWLNTNWTRFAAEKKRSALFNCLVKEYRNRKFRKQRQGAELSDSELIDICKVYESIESQHDPGNVTPYQVVLNLIAGKHGVSPRLMTDVRAENHKRWPAIRVHQKARS